MGEVGEDVKRIFHGRKEHKMGANPIQIGATLKVFDRLVSAYERSCEIELEKEKVAAELELGLRRMDVEEKKLNAQYKAVMRVIATEEKKLDACIQEMDAKIKMLEKHQKITIGYCDRLMACICETKDDKKRESMQSVLLQFHASMAEQLSAASGSFSKLLSHASPLTGIATTGRTKMLSVKEEGL